MGKGNSFFSRLSIMGGTLQFFLIMFSVSASCETLICYFPYLLAGRCYIIHRVTVG